MESTPERSTFDDFDIYHLGSEYIDLYYLRHYGRDKQPQLMPISCLEAQIRHQSWEDEKTGASPAKNHRRI